MQTFRLWRSCAPSSTWPALWPGARWHRQHRYLPVRRLESLQHEFQRFLLGEDNSIEGDIVATQRVPAQVRLAIYGDGYRARLIEALEHSYPVLASLLDEQFETAAAKYVS